jgi:hypothetical protein
VALQVPLPAVRVCPTVGVPVMVGATELVRTVARNTRSVAAALTGVTPAGDTHSTTPAVGRVSLPVDTMTERTPLVSSEATRPPEAATSTAMAWTALSHAAVTGVVVAGRSTNGRICPPGAA